LAYAELKVNFVEGFAVSMFGLAGSKANRLAVLQTDWFSVRLLAFSSFSPLG
jgi:hypothetical protein